MRRNLLGLAVAAAVVSGGALTASADTLRIDVSTPIVTSLGGGFWKWEYKVELVGAPGAPSELRSGDFLSIFDFDATVSALSLPAGWGLTTEVQTSFPIVGIASTDSIGLTNLRFDYTGGTVSSTGVVSLGSLVLKVDTDKGLLDNYGGTDFNPALNRVQVNIDSTITPNTRGTPVPLPIAAWAGLGLMGVVAAKARRRA